MRIFSILQPDHLRTDGVHYLWVDVNEDWGRQALDEVLDDTEDVLSHGGKVVVHCNAGKHRTGAFCALLMAAPGISLLLVQFVA